MHILLLLGGCSINVNKLFGSAVQVFYILIAFMSIVLTIIERGVLNSLTVIVHLSTSPQNPIIFLL